MGINYEITKLKIYWWQSRIKPAKTRSSINKHQIDHKFTNIQTPLYKKYYVSNPTKEDMIIIA